MSMFSPKSSARKAGVSFFGGKVQLLELEHGKSPVVITAVEGDSPLDLRLLLTHANQGPSQASSLTQAITQLIKRNKVKAKTVSFALPPDGVFVNTVPVADFIKGPKLAEFLRWEVGQYFEGWSANDYLLSAASVPIRDPDAQYTLVVSLRRSTVSFFRKVAEQLGMTVGTLDLQHFCTEKALSANHPESRNQSILLVSLLEGLIEISHLSKGHLVDYRRYVDLDVRGALYAHMKSISERDSLPKPQALYVTGDTFAEATVEECAESSGLPATPVEPFAKLDVPRRMVQAIGGGSVRFAAAAGLALRIP